MDEWIKTTDNPPKMQDASCLGKVCMDWGKPIVGEWKWETVAQFPERFPYWTKHPAPPKEMEVDRENG